MQLDLNEDELKTIRLALDKRISSLHDLLTKHGNLNTNNLDQAKHRTMKLRDKIAEARRQEANR